MLIICVGPPGCGKTTAVNRWHAKYLSVKAAKLDWSGAPRIRLSRDGLRDITGIRGNRDIHSPELEGIITLGQHAAIKAWLEGGIDVAVDDTCQRQGTMDAWVQIARRARTRLVVWDFRQVPLELCIFQDLRRERTEREEVIRKIASRCARVKIPLSAEVIEF